MTHPLRESQRRRCRIFVAALVLASLTACRGPQFEFIENAVLVASPNGHRLVIMEKSFSEAFDGSTVTHQRLVEVDPRTGAELGVISEQRYALPTALWAARGPYYWLRADSGIFWLVRLGEEPIELRRFLAATLPRWSDGFNFTVDAQGLLRDETLSGGCTQVDVAVPIVSTCDAPYGDHHDFTPTVQVTWSYDGGTIVQVGRTFISLAADGSQRWSMSR